MADVTKAELQSVMDDLRQARDNNLAFEHRLKAVVDRLERVESFKDKAEPAMWMITAAKWALGLFGVLLASGIVWSAARMSELGAVVQQHQVAIAELKEAQKKESEDNRQANLRLMLTILERLPGRFQQMTHKAMEGRVLKVSETEIAIEGPGNTKTGFHVGPMTEFFIKGKPVKPLDLKPGSKVIVGFTEQGIATRVEAVEE